MLISGLLFLSTLMVVGKWKKVLMAVIILELSSLLILGGIYSMPGGVSSMLMLVLVFMVAEALILLSAFYFSLQLSGIGSGILNLE